MPSYPSSTCATCGSEESTSIITVVPSSPSTEARALSKHSSKRKRKPTSRIGRTSSPKASSSKPASNPNTSDQSSSLVTITTALRACDEHNYSTSNLVAEYLDQASTLSIIHALSNCPTRPAQNCPVHRPAPMSFLGTPEDLDQASQPFSYSTSNSLQDLDAENHYSLSYFAVGFTNLHTKRHKSIEESIEAHITAMTAHLEDFDALFAKIEGCADPTVERTSEMMI